MFFKCDVPKNITCNKKVYIGPLFCVDRRQQNRINLIHSSCFFINPEPFKLRSPIWLQNEDYDKLYEEVHSPVSGVSSVYVPNNIRLSTKRTKYFFPL